MESLLRWSIANSGPRDPNQPPPQPRSDLDPGIIDMILGKPDSELMKEALAIAVDESKNEDDRLQALDNFEMLIEQIDNANNIEKLKMWEPLHGLLTNPTSSEDIQRQVLWILGTAVQNNPAAQHSYLALSPLRTLLSFLSPTIRSGKTRAKAVYALSGLLKHNAAAVRQMADAGGWAVLRDALQDSDIAVRRKVAFLLNTLLIPTGVEAEAHARARAEEARPANVQQPLQVPTSVEGVVAAAEATPVAPSAPVPSTESQQQAQAPAQSELRPQAQDQSQAVMPHPSSPALNPAPSQSTQAPPNSTSTSTSTSTAAHASPALSPPQTVHPNSHASMVSDPSSASTSGPTLHALEHDGLLSSLVGALAAPVPHGADGEREGDADFEEKVLRSLHTYSTAHGRALPADEGQRLGRYLREQESREGGEERLAERWNFTRDEVRELKKAAEPALEMAP
ncbi:nucleotide exchange factor Fes1-domain-containing protein [Trametes punicea]|nr:nucleotide exchange factor Fes1-domain-containing protein [Trametes punicea]